MKDEDVSVNVSVIGDKRTGVIEPQTIGEVLANPPHMGESEIVKEVNRRIKKFDEYERIDGYRCALCPPDANWHPASEIYPDDEYGDLCKRCLDEVEEAREIEEQEKKFHHKGGI